VTRFECIDRLVQGLSALFLALRRRPVIRYQKGSNAAQRLAEGLYALTYKQQVRLPYKGTCMCLRDDTGCCCTYNKDNEEMGLASTCRHAAMKLLTVRHQCRVLHRPLVLGGPVSLLPLPQTESSMPGI
jgi:hypothetical protein